MDALTPHPGPHLIRDTCNVVPAGGHVRHLVSVDLLSLQADPEGAGLYGLAAQSGKPVSAHRHVCVELTLSSSGLALLPQPAPREHPREEPCSRCGSPHIWTCCSWHSQQQM